MLIEHCTEDYIRSKINRLEQISLAALSLNQHELPELAQPVLEHLNEELSSLACSFTWYVKNTQAGGMGEAPMQDALEPSSC